MKMTLGSSTRKLTLGSSTRQFEPRIAERKQRLTPTGSVRPSVCPPARWYVRPPYRSPARQNVRPSASPAPFRPVRPVRPVGTSARPTTRPSVKMFVRPPRPPPSAPFAPSAPSTPSVHPVRPPAPACPSTRSPAPSAPPPLSTRCVCAPARTHFRPVIQQVVRPIVHRPVGQIDNKGTTEKYQIVVVSYPRPPSPPSYRRPLCPPAPSVRLPRTSVRPGIRPLVRPVVCQSVRPSATSTAEEKPKIQIKNKHLDSRGKLSS